MAKLVVRNLDDDVKQRLQVRAARRGRSMEEEVRDILRTATLAWDDETAPEPLGTRIARRFAGLTDDMPELHGQAARAAELGEE